MPKIIVIDQKKCTGCRQCELVCSVKNTGESNPVRARINIIKWDVDGFYLPVICQQCSDAPCKAACPTGALTRNLETGVINLNYHLCIGCKMCVMACPFGAMTIDTVEEKVIKCEHCEGDPTCVKFCVAGALKYEEATDSTLKKKREAGKRLCEIMNAK